jgi:large repetitive protein
MKKILYSFFICLALIVVTGVAHSQTATVTIYYSGAQALGCCNVCGTDYRCIGGSGCGCCQASQQTKTFMNPVPAGNYITSVQIRYYAADCSAQNVPTSINGIAICTANNPGPRTCACGSCNQAYCTNSNFPCGLPNYNYGGINTLYAAPYPSYSEICTQRCVITFTYAPGSPGGPPTPGVISGSATICPGQSYTYSITPVSGATSYSWTVPPGSTITSGQGTTSITMTAGSSGGNVCVTATNICGTSPASCITLTIGAPPATPGAISGPTVFCPGQSSTYSIAPVSGGTSYNWTVPSGTTINSGQGTTSITVTHGANAGQVCVTASGPCGTSSATCLTLTLGTAPVAPGTITGAAVFCPGDTYTYTISSVTGATSYNWTVPSGATINSGQGTTSISVTYGVNAGQVCVTATGACGTSPSTCLTVTLGTAPASPGAITGPTTFCPTETFSYSISAVSGATSYTWTVPTGSTINSGQGSTNISVTFGANAGQICVTATGACGTSSPTCITLNLGAPPSPPASINGTFTGCPGATVSFSTPSAPATTYNWTVPTGSVINSGQGTSGITVTLGQTSGNICVTATTICGTSTPICEPVNVFPVPTVTNAPLSQNVCSGQASALVMLTGSVAGTTFTWTSSASAGVTGNTASGTGNIPSQNLQNSTTSPGTVTYTIIPTANGCTGTTAQYTITVNPTPTVTNSPLSQTVCSGQPVNINFTGSIPGTTFTWTATCSNGNVTGFTPSGTGNVSHTLINNLNTMGTVAYIITPELSGCSGPPAIYVVNVHPAPTVTNSPLSLSICSGQTANINFTGNVTGTTFSWTASNTSGTVTGFPPSGTGNISHTLTNGLPTPGTVTYTITPTANGCNGAPVNYVVTVSQDYPVSVSIASNPSGPVCEGTQVVFTATPVNGGSGPDFQWQLNGANVGMNSPTYTTTTLPTGTNTISCILTSNSGSCITGNPALATYDITVHALPNASINPSGPYCIDAPATNLTAVNAGGTWSGTGITDFNTGLFNPATAGAGTHIITYFYTDPATGCSATGTANFTVNNLPVVTFAALNPICVSAAPIALSGGSPAGGNYSGTGVAANMFGPAQAGPGVHTLTYTYTDPGTGCTNSATQVISVNTDFDVVVTPDSVAICRGASVNLTAIGGVDYTWHPSTGLSATTGSSVYASPQVTTLYTVTGENTDGCTGSTTVVVYVHPYIGVSFTANPASGCSPLDVQFNFAGGPYWAPGTHVWNFGDLYSGANSSTLNNPTHTYEYPGTYEATLTVTNTFGCVESGSQQIMASARPVANFTSHPPDFSTMDNPEILFVNQSTNYQTLWWNFGEPSTGPLNFSDQETPTHMFTDEGTYIVSLVAMTSIGCSDTIQKPYNIYPSYVLFVPNAFSPDGDGLNEEFRPIISGLDEDNYFFSIYDRWGRKVFETRDATKGWNGRVGAERDAKQDVYAWILIVWDKTGKKYKHTGRVTLLN